MRTRIPPIPPAIKPKIRRTIPIPIGSVIKGPRPILSTNNFHIKRRTKKPITIESNALSHQTPTSAKKDRPPKTSNPEFKFEKKDRKPCTISMKPPISASQYPAKRQFEFVCEGVVIDMY